MMGTTMRGYPNRTMLLGSCIVGGLKNDKHKKFPGPGGH